MGEYYDFEESTLVFGQVFWYQENVRFHKCLVALAKFNETGYALLLPPPYSPDLASSDFSCFQT